MLAEKMKLTMLTRDLRSSKRAMREMHISYGLGYISREQSVLFHHLVSRSTYGKGIRT